MDTLFFVFFLVFVMVIGLLAIRELVIWKATRDDPEAPYPRRRLIRRMTIAAIMMIVIFALRFKPDRGDPYFDLAWLGICFVLMLILVALALRDMRETSVEVVRARGEFNDDSSKALMEAVRIAKEEHEKQMEAEADSKNKDDGADV